MFHKDWKTKNILSFLLVWTVIEHVWYRLAYKNTCLVTNSLFQSFRRSVRWGAARKTVEWKIREKRGERKQKNFLTERLEEARPPVMFDRQTVSYPFRQGSRVNSLLRKRRYNEIIQMLWLLDLSSSDWIEWLLKLTLRDSKSPYSLVKGLHTSQMAHHARGYPSFCSAHEANRSISTPPWTKCQSISGLPPALNSSLPIEYKWPQSFHLFSSNIT